MHKFREKLIFKLCRTFNNEEVQFILDQIDSVLTDYELREKVSLPSVGDDGVFLQRFLEAKHIEGMSKTSAKVYVSELKDFYRNIAAPITLVSSQNIRDYLIALKTERNVSDRSLEHRRIVLNSFYSWMYENDYVTKNPCQRVKRIKYRKTTRQPLTAKEMEQVRYVCRNDLRSTALVEFMYSTGCRISEVCGVRISDIDFYNKEVRVVGKGNKERIVYLNTAAEIAIKRYLNDRKINTDYLFTQTRSRGNVPVSTDAVRYTFRKIGEAAGLERVLHPHDIRHTTATDALTRGMPIEDVQSYLGHSRLDTTMIYVKLDKQRVKANHKKCFS